MDAERSGLITKTVSSLTPTKAAVVFSSIFPEAHRESKGMPIGHGFKHTGFGGIYECVY